MHRPASYPELTLQRADGVSVRLPDLAGRVLLVVNLASRCAYTPQYRGLEAIHQRFRGRGLEVMGFPCNDFGEQEPAALPEILEFCRKNFGATFDIFEKVEIAGRRPHPFFAWLTGPESPFPGAVRWNFEKFVLGRDGRLRARFRSPVDPLSDDLVAAIESAVAELQEAAQGS